jgi:hypothetical protein
VIGPNNQIDLVAVAMTAPNSLSPAPDTEVNAVSRLDLVCNHSCSFDLSLCSPHLRCFRMLLDDAGLASILAALTGSLPPRHRMFSVVSPTLLNDVG